MVYILALHACRLMYDEPIDVEVIAKRIGDIKQFYTQHARVRLFVVSIVFGGINKTGNRVFVTDPLGSYRGYQAVAVYVGRYELSGSTNRPVSTPMHACKFRSQQKKGKSPFCHRFCHHLTLFYIITYYARLTYEGLKTSLGGQRLSQTRCNSCVT